VDSMHRYILCIKKLPETSLDVRNDKPGRGRMLAITKSITIMQQVLVAMTSDQRIPGTRGSTSRKPKVSLLGMPTLLRQKRQRSIIWMVRSPPRLAKTLFASPSTSLVLRLPEPRTEPKLPPFINKSGGHELTSSIFRPAPHSQLSHSPLQYQNQKPTGRDLSSKPTAHFAQAT